MQLTDSERLLGLLGLARRGGKLTLGTVATRQAIRSRKVCLLLMAEDLAGSSASRASQLARAMNVPVVQRCRKVELSAALGRENLGIVGVTDPSLARSIREIISASTAAGDR